MNKSIYVVWDIIAAAMVGPLMVFQHDAPASREFTEVLADPKTSLGRNPADYQLLKIGEISENGTLSPGLVTTVLTGREWLARQENGRGA